MIANLKRGEVTFHAFDMPDPRSEVEDDTVMIPEVVFYDRPDAGIWEGVWVLKGLQYNDHANRHELVYELATGVYRV